jgi:hypothetical protein
MTTTRSRRHLAILATVSAVSLLTIAAPARAQIRGLYPPGMNATNSGVLPGAGLSYQALFQPYSFDEAKTADGRRLPFNGKTSVLVDQNIFMWVSKASILGGAYAAVADLPVANTSLTTVRFGALAGGSGASPTRTSRPSRSAGTSPARISRQDTALWRRRAGSSRTQRTTPAAATGATC